jgi:hypothetical protein
MLKRSNTLVCALFKLLIAVEVPNKILFLQFIIALPHEVMCFVL